MSLLSEKLISAAVADEDNVAFELDEEIDMLSLNRLRVIVEIQDTIYNKLDIKTFKGIEDECSWQWSVLGLSS